MNKITFFSKEKRHGKLKVGDANRRKIIISLLETKSPPSARQLSARSKAPYTETYDNIKKFVKSGYVKPIVVAQHSARTDSKYELTLGGKLVALAISVDDNKVLGDVTDTLQKIFQPERGSDSLTFFVKYVLLNASTKGLQRYVLEFVRNLIESSETSDEPNLWKIAQNGASNAKPSELDTLKKSVLQALSGLDASQKDTVIQFYKTKATDMMFDTAMKSHNAKMQELARKTSRDDEGIFTRFECKNKRCGFQQDELYLKMEDVILRVFSGGIPCPKCKRLETKSHDRKGFRDRIQTMTQ